jgi:hypothetical protein
VYNRFRTYSYTNQAYLWEQGAREPVASMKVWNALGRTVLAGSKAYEIIVPIFTKKDKEDPEAEPVIIGFRPLRRIFTYSQTKGEELPPVQLPEWDIDMALAQLGIRRVPFNELNGNIQGISRGRDITINPVAANPAKTLFHELGHVILGHTSAESFPEYVTHKGILEYEAEATAYLTTHELGRLDEETATRSRAYIQTWLRGERPPDKAIREAFRTTDLILKSGRLAISPPEKQE